MTIGRGLQAFPRAEYLRRVAAVKAEMARLDIHALVVNNAANVAYLSGYTVSGSWGILPQALVVAIDKEEPTLIVRQSDAPAAIHQTFLERANVIGFREGLVGKQGVDGFDAVIDFLQEAGMANRGLGVEVSYLPPQTTEKFKARLPKAKIIDCTKAVAWIRFIKSDLEISVMREAAAIADAGILRAAEVIRPGVREADAVAEIVATLVRGANGKSGTNIPPIYLCSSPRTGTCHIRWSEDTFRDGSQVNLELGGSRYGYYVGLMRTYSIGAPSDRLRSLHEAEVAGLEAALETVRPGATCSDVANAFYRTSKKMGFNKESRCGYPIGINWTEPTASLQDGDMTELKPNMTFHLMLGNWIDEDFGYVISETFRVTESGAEVLTSAPRRLFEVG
ncbi:Xaa-Pro peptidase family protein [Bradyrhizobium arachidis]|uniref:M24 family metallopeptidase n=1 Tax=Bradyrhizobium arachidis TaxID=858423 RepID=UPI00216180F8|nr:Xaa-Pro peptidase family protein [Bradyrhizobium arachidis]UVO30440.1 Xaa-Pro peptidase family protein [Bradyrhizobium arachidis]